MSRILKPILSFLLILAFLDSQDILAQESDSEPIPVFLTPGVIPSDVADLHQRALTSYPDMTRSRLVKINPDIFHSVFGVSKDEGSQNIGTLSRGQINVDDGVGVGTQLTLNFFDDHEIDVVVDKSAAGKQRTPYHHLLLQPASGSGQSRYLTITIIGYGTPSEYVHIKYGSGYEHTKYFSLRRIPDTRYYVLIERSRGPNHYFGEILQPEIFVGNTNTLPAQLISDVSVAAEVGPIIGYGLAAFSFANENDGFAISNRANAGHSPRAYKTVNGGKSWHDFAVESDWVPGNIYFRDHRNGYLSLRFNPVGHSIQNIRGCGLLRTEDGGNRWERLKHAADDYCLSNIRFHKDGTGYAFGWNRGSRKGWIWRSTDDGRSWAAWTEIPGSLLSVQRIEIFDDVIIPVSHSGSYSGNRGIDVVGLDGSIRDSIYVGYPEVRQIRFVDRNVIFANASDELGSYLLRSTDGGVTWFRLLEGRFGLVYTRTADEFGIVIWKGSTSRSDVSGPVSAFAYTSDGGKSWVEGPTNNLSPFLEDKYQRLDDGTELTLLGNNLLRVSPRN